MIFPKYSRAPALKQAPFGRRGRRAARQIPGADVQTTASLGIAPGAGYAEWALALLRKLGIRKVAVPDTFPLGPAKKIDEGGCDLVIRPARSIRPERLVKTPDELKKLRAAVNGNPDAAVG